MNNLVGIPRSIVCALLAMVMLATGMYVLPMNASAEFGIVHVSQGTSVTVWEATGWQTAYTYTVEQLTAGVSFSTYGHEDYYVSTDGTYLTIKCNRWWTPYPDPDPIATGNNICAVLLSGVPEYPDGLWAKSVVSYQIGAHGAAESLPNALGPVNQIGPYGNATCTFLGDGWSQMTLAFSQLPPPPVANAGPDQLVRVGDIVNLDGSGSVAEEGCTFVWTSWTHSQGYIELIGVQASCVFDCMYRASPTLFTLTVTDEYGQISRDYVDIYGIFSDGAVHKGDAPLYDAECGMSVDTTISVTLENHGLKSVTVLITWPALPKSANVLMKINFADAGAYPTGTVTTQTVLSPGPYIPWVIIKDADGLRAGYADIWVTNLPVGVVIG